eukprot:m.198636 g.198636  ORF g.198636 m.198636 type:complete len:364 (+) comp15485_c1_seq2:2183-3274(+)
MHANTSRNQKHRSSNMSPTTVRTCNGHHIGLGHNKHCQTSSQSTRHSIVTSNRNKSNTKTTNTNAYTSTQHTLRCSLRQVLLVSADWRGSLSSLASAALAAMPCYPGSQPSQHIRCFGCHQGQPRCSLRSSRCLVCSLPLPLSSPVGLLASRGLTLTPLQVVSSTCLPGRHLPRPPALTQCPAPLSLLPHLGPAIRASSVVPGHRHSMPSPCGIISGTLQPALSPGPALAHSSRPRAAAASGSHPHRRARPHSSPPPSVALSPRSSGPHAAGIMSPTLRGIRAITSPPSTSRLFDGSSHKPSGLPSARPCCAGGLLLPGHPHHHPPPGAWWWRAVHRARCCSTAVHPRSQHRAQSPAPAALPR